MVDLAIIGGSGLTRIEGFEAQRHETVNTPFGDASAPLMHGLLDGRQVLFLPRHGVEHHIPPHKVNYRANVWALRKAGAKRIIGVAAVGGISSQASPGTVVVPDQIIDYTYGRKHTYFEDDLTQVTHIDFTDPYCESLRQLLIGAAQQAGVPVVLEGTYGATQGPRLETTSEINRMERDGCDLVGMTGMPEAALARELDLCYASCAVVANWAAGRSEGPIMMKEIESNLTGGMKNFFKLLSCLPSDASTPSM
ncbi:MAG: S-methyl-5'-thioinosine phosphorylase [Gammaproteobacteria bacterium]|nr:S-methyl-5'-thioinosine phosphorylase [Gammaproteobacteria bacterium]